MKAAHVRIVKQDFGLSFLYKQMLFDVYQGRVEVLVNRPQISSVIGLLAVPDDFVIGRHQGLFIRKCRLEVAKSDKKGIDGDHD